MSADRFYYDAEGFAINLGYERHGPVSPLRETLERTKRLIGRSLDLPVRDMADMVLAEALKGIYVALASADGRRMAETENTGSVPQGTTSATGEAGDAHDVST